MQSFHRLFEKVLVSPPSSHRVEGDGHLQEPSACKIYWISEDKQLETNSSHLKMSTVLKVTSPFQDYYDKQLVAT